MKRLDYHLLAGEFAMRWMCLLMLVGCSENSERLAPKPEKIDLKSASATLWGEFDDNPVAAEQKYVGKWVEIIGEVTQIESSGDKVVVGLGVIIAVGMSPEEFNRLSYQERKWFQEGYPANVLVTMAAASKSAVAEIKKGETVTLQAICKGTKKKAGVWRGMVVEFDNGSVKKN